MTTEQFYVNYQFSDEKVNDNMELTEDRVIELLDSFYKYKTKYYKTTEILPKITGDVIKSATTHKGRVEEHRDSDYVLVFFNGLWRPAVLQLLKRNGELNYYYSWKIKDYHTWYVSLQEVEFWSEMLNNPNPQQ